MPTLSANAAGWETHDWGARGEEWSVRWGGADVQWWATVFPRIGAFLPAGTILEIAPGFGRWTHFLREHCEQLVGIDLAEACVSACRERFAGDTRLSFHRNDGRSLAAVADGSIDFAFSLDSLVHAEADVLHAYVSGLADKLADDGVAFLHHANLAAYPAAWFAGDNSGWRGTSVSADIVAAYARGCGLRPVVQELVDWAPHANPTVLSDCFTVLTRPGSRWDREPVVVETAGFEELEVAPARRRAAAYGVS
jgi:hypothetical protein